MLVNTRQITGQISGQSGQTSRWIGLGLGRWLDWFHFLYYYCIINHQGILTVIITVIVK